MGAPESSSTATTMRRGSSSSSTAAAEAESLRANYLWFALMFAVNHGVVTTPLVIATSVLEKGVGYTGNALINIATLCSAFLLAAPTVAAAGLKRALMIGMLLYCAYTALFAVAALAPAGSPLQRIAFCGGSTLGGIAAGILWTSQGSYFGRHVDLLLEVQPEEGRPAISAKLAGTFAVPYLACEVCAKLLWSLLAWLELPGPLVGVIFTIIGFVALCGMVRVRDLDLAQPPAHWTAKVQEAVHAWRDPSVFLLGGMNVTFGFTAAFMNGYVNANYTAQQLGSFAVAMLAAFTALTAAVMARAFGPLAARVGKFPVVTLGAGCFLCIPLCAFVLGCCQDWGWWLIVLYIFQGTGRAVFESTNKAVFADFFPGEASVGAFANVMLQSSLSFAISFFLGARLQGPALGAIVVVLACLTPLGYATAILSRRAAAGKPSEKERNSDSSSASETEASETTEEGNP